MIRFIAALRHIGVTRVLIKDNELLVHFENGDFCRLSEADITTLLQDQPAPKS